MAAITPEGGSLDLHALLLLAHVRPACLWLSSTCPLHSRHQPILCATRRRSWPIPELCSGGSTAYRVAVPVKPEAKDSGKPVRVVSYDRRLAFATADASSRPQGSNCATRCGLEITAPNRARLRLHQPVRRRARAASSSTQRVRRTNRYKLELGRDKGSFQLIQGPLRRQGSRRSARSAFASGSGVQQTGENWYRTSRVSSTEGAETRPTHVGGAAISGSGVPKRTTRSRRGARVG